MIERTQARIRSLDPHVVNQIAAGEVIERPASVVKELVENALDAHASRIDVFLEEGGTRLIRVVDDGWGMDQEDLALAFLPHATSKLSTVEDLDSIATLGFRGEALASIGAVSQARILSRVREEASGHLVEDRGGRLAAPRGAAAAPGTEVVVENLFFNTPARARFLKSTRTELGHIQDLMVRFALAWPEVGFRLSHAGSDLLRTEPGEDRLQRLRSLFGRELADSLIEAKAGWENGRAQAWLGPPHVTRPTAQEIHLFVNGRSVRDKILLRVLRDTYRDAMHGGRYPLAFVFVEIDPSFVDVNVHPTKSEVRWRDPRFLHAVLGPAFAEALRGANLAVRLDATDAPPPSPEERTARVRDAVDDFLRKEDRWHEASPAEGADAAPFSVFQVHDAYLVCEVEDGLAIVDQHALHERVHYDRILRRLTEGGVTMQRLLVPETVEIDAADAGLLDENRELLRRCGIEWSEIGSRAVALEAIPAVIRRERAPELLRDLLGLLRTHGPSVEARALFHDVADTMACKAAVRFGDRMSREEAAALLKESRALDRAYVCPHGRPTVLRITFEELERRFGRR